MSDTIRILIADDHAVVREGLKGIIASEPGMELVGEAKDGVVAVEQALALRPDVILLDLKMPRQDGLATILKLKETMPDVRILVLTSFVEEEKIFPALSAGAQGYLLKESSAEELVSAIRQVHAGQTALHPDVASKVVRKLNRQTDSPVADVLTAREVEVLRLMARGLSNAEIAKLLCVSEHTVRNHTASILSKLGLANRTQATLYALRMGLVDADKGPTT